jgi:hypothetical protein
LEKERQGSLGLCPVVRLLWSARAVRRVGRTLVGDLANADRDFGGGEMRVGDVTPICRSGANVKGVRTGRKHEQKREYKQRRLFCKSIRHTMVS